MRGCNLYCTDRTNMPLNIKLRLAIHERGLSQIEVASRVGINEPRMSKIARGWIDPTDDEKKAIAKILRKPVDQLFPSSKVPAA